MKNKILHHIIIFILFYFAIVFAIICESEEITVIIKPEPDKDLLLKWTTPDKRINGKDLAISEIEYFSISWDCDASGMGRAQVHGTKTSFILPKDIIGNCTFSLTATAGSTSDPAIITVFIQLPKPKSGGFRNG